MIDIFEIQKFLVKKGISVTLNWSRADEQFYLDLNTRAKSGLHLYEDLTLVGRYDKTKLRINENETIESVGESLCWHFFDCLHGRNYWNGDWEKLCNEYNIKLRD